MIAIGLINMLALASTVWLCHPGTANDPCESDLTATRIDGTHAQIVTTAQPSAPRAVDCFYVYPTVSQEPADNADLTIQPVEREAAREQASRFSPLCNVWAPMYRQVTQTALEAGRYGEHRLQVTAYTSLRAAWIDYLEHDNGGRPIVFIGHSQGAQMLAYLLRQDVDDNEVLRSRMISALLIGANIYSRTGADTSGWFSHILACRSQTQTACVIAYSTYDTTPPTDAIFGTPHLPGTSIICTNPAALRGGEAPLDSYFLSSETKPPIPVTTPWTQYRDLYAGQCMQRDNTTWFQVVRTPATRRTLPSVGASSPQWGLHVYDVAIALGNLVDDVKAQIASYESR